MYIRWLSLYFESSEVFKVPSVAAVEAHARYVIVTERLVMASPGSDCLWGKHDFIADFAGVLLVLMLFLFEIEVLVNICREGLDIMVVVGVVVVYDETLADWDEESQVQDLSLCPLSDVHVICQD